MRRAGWGVLLVTATVGVAGAAPARPPGSPTAPAPGPPPRAARPVVNLPAVPVLEAPTGVNGAHGVRELIVMGAPLRGTSLAVTGYVTWIYDCVTDIQRRGESKSAVLRRIDADPTLCQRAKFYLGDSRDTVPERALWIVDVPRPFNKLERERIDPADRTLQNYPDRCEPDPRRPRGPFCVPLAVGDHVTVAGSFVVRSPHNENNSDGLIVFSSLVPTAPPTTPTMVRPPVMAPVPPLTVKAAAPSTGIEAARAASRAQRRQASLAHIARDYPRAETGYRAAIATWPGNHSAWYGLAGVLVMQGDWVAATHALAKAFELVPDKAPYVTNYGVASYEAAIVEAHARQAREAKLPPAQVDVDMAAVDFTRAVQVLRHAVSLDEGEWRAHYYLGRIARDTGHSQEAAAAFTRALASAPTEANPWVALGELYRRWQRSDLARQVVEQGLQVVPAAATADLWYVLGLAHDQEGHAEPAIAAFTRTLDLAPAHGKALYQRGQALFLQRKLAAARRDLEASLAQPGLEVARPQALKMLSEIAAKTGR